MVDAPLFLKRFKQFLFKVKFELNRQTELFSNTFRLAEIFRLLRAVLRFIGFLRLFTMFQLI